MKPQITQIPQMKAEPDAAGVVAGSPATSAESAQSAVKKKLLAEFHMWFHRWQPPTADKAADRQAKLLFLARTLGRAVDSSSELSAEDLELVIKEARSNFQRASRKVRRFPGGTRPTADGELLPTREQLWKVEQLNAWLGWRDVPSRMEGFLDHHFGRKRADELTAAGVWRAIEALISVGARDRVKQRLGADHQVTEAELTAEKKVVKRELKTWRAHPPEKGREEHAGSLA